MARTAARRRAKQDLTEEVDIHPTVFKYFSRGDLKQSVEPILQNTERQLKCSIDPAVAFLLRIRHSRGELLTHLEIGFFGESAAGSNRGGFRNDRIEPLIESMLTPLEKRVGTSGDRGIHIRVQRVGTKLLPVLITGKLNDTETAVQHHELKNLDSVG